MEWDSTHSRPLHTSSVNYLMLTVKLTKTQLTDPQDDALWPCRDPGMLGVDERHTT
jgi:hypothetical protein